MDDACGSLDAVKTCATLGFLKPGYVDEVMERWAHYSEANAPALEDCFSQQQVADIDAIHTSVLDTLKEPPQGWRRLIYSRWFVSIIVLWQNTTKQAAKCAAAELDHFCSLLDVAKRYEAEAPDGVKRMATQRTGFGYFGVDRHGVSVLYFRPALSDAYSIEKEWGIQRYCQHMDYFTLFFWDTRCREAMASGQHRRLVYVVDCSDYDMATLRRSWAGMGPLTKWCKTYPTGKGPMDGTRKLLIRNVPPMLALLLNAVGLFLSSKTKARVQLFTTKQDAAFQEALFEQVHPTQVPRSMGGECDQPFSLDRG